MKQMKAVEIRQARGPLQLVEREVSSDTAGTLDEVKKPGVFKKAERSSACFALSVHEHQCASYPSSLRG